MFSYSTSPPPMEKLAWNRGTMGKKRESDNLRRRRRRRRSNCRGIRYDFIMRQPERARRAHAVRNKQMFSHNSAAKFIFRQDGDGGATCEAVALYSGRGLMASFGTIIYRKPCKNGGPRPRPSLRLRHGVPQRVMGYPNRTDHRMRKKCH